jgi:hypothetical protein
MGEQFESESFVHHCFTDHWPLLTDHCEAPYPECYSEINDPDAAFV